MSRYTNPSGYVKYDNEKELCDELEKFFFPNFFDKGWIPIEDITKEVWISKDRRIDYYGLKNNKKTYVEVKNWWVTNKDIYQFLCYWNILYRPIQNWRKVIVDEKLLQKELGFDFYVICGGVDKDKRKALDWEGVKINYILTRDIKELNPNEVLHWM